MQYNVVSERMGVDLAPRGGWTSLGTPSFYCGAPKLLLWGGDTVCPLEHLGI